MLTIDTDQFSRLTAIKPLKKFQETMRKNILLHFNDDEKKRYFIHTSKFVYDEDKTTLVDNSHHFFFC